MRYAFRTSSFKSGELAIASRRRLHQSRKHTTEFKDYQSVNRSSNAPGSITTSISPPKPFLTEGQRKDRLLEDLIRKSTQVSLKSGPINNTMPPSMDDHRSPSKTHSYIQFITTPTADTPGTALLLHFPDKRYVIGNIHEGLQRAGLQVGAKFFRARDFFLTGKTEWRTNGGLLGMILTLADATKASAESRADNARIKFDRQLAMEEEVRQTPWKHKAGSRQGSHQHNFRTKAQQSLEEHPTVNLHGGPNLTHTIATARSFIFRHGTPIRVNENHEEEEKGAAENNWEPTWEDKNIQVWAMAISPSSGDENLRPGTPRKRSLGEYMSGQDRTMTDADDEWSPKPKLPADEDKRKQQIREFVVAEMFSSSWRADNLVETPLHEVVTPAALFIRDPLTRKIQKYTGPVPDGTTPLPDIKVLVRQPWPGALVNYLPSTKPSTVAMSYIIRNHKQRGKFKREAAMALQLPPGSLWSSLARGEAVQSYDGQTITPDMVLEPSKDGGGIAVIDLPSKEYVNALISRLEWNTSKVMSGVGGIIWILGPGVSQDPSLRDFMESKADLKQIISSTDHCPNYLVQTPAATTAIRNHQIDPLRYPIPFHSDATQVPLGQLGDEPQTSQQLYAARRGLKVDLEPAFGINELDVIPYLDTDDIVQKMPESVISLARIAQQEIQSTSMQAETADQSLPSPDAEIICLGTGSAVPSSYRNVAGTLLRVPGHGSYLLDCGEDTLGQLKRVFTESELAEVFRDLKLIWISHLHADHHLGTASVIRAWYEEVHGRDPVERRRPTATEALLDPARFLEEGKKLSIVGHGYMMRWLMEYSSVEDFGYDQLIPLSSIPTHWTQPDRCDLEWNGLNVGFNTSKDPRVQNAIRKVTSLSNLVTVSVAHCYGAQAVALTFPNGFKFSYSGDCRPSRDFAIIGSGSTVLLHEATFDDELAGDAKAKKHSTTSEAIGVGLAMGAKRLILTHFSQRYQKIPAMGSIQSVSVKLENAEEMEDPMDVMEPPVNIEEEPIRETEIPVADLKEDISQEPQNVEIENVESQSPKTTFTDPKLASLQSRNSLMRPPAQDMKIVVASDYMRVKVGEILHLEKFTPALQQLYKEAEKEEREEKAKRAAIAKEEEEAKKEAREKTREEKEKVKREAMEACGGGRKDFTSPNSKIRRVGWITKGRKGTKAETNASHWRRKERIEADSDINEGKGRRERSITPPTLETRRNHYHWSPASNVTGEQGDGETRSVEANHSAHATPPDAFAPGLAAEVRTAPDASRSDTQAAEDIQSTTVESSAPEASRPDTQAADGTQATDVGRSPSETLAPDVSMSDTQAADDIQPTIIESSAPEASMSDIQAVYDIQPTTVESSAPVNSMSDTQAEADSQSATVGISPPETSAPDVSMLDTQQAGDIHPTAIASSAPETPAPKTAMPPTQTADETQPTTMRSPAPATSAPDTSILSTQTADGIQHPSETPTSAPESSAPKPSPPPTQPPSNLHPPIPPPTPTTPSNPTPTPTPPPTQQTIRRSERIRLKRQSLGVGGDTVFLERRGSEERVAGQREVGDIRLRGEGDVDVDEGVREGSGEGRLGEEGEVAAQHPAEGEGEGEKELQSAEA